MNINKLTTLFFMPVFFLGCGSETRLEKGDNIFSGNMQIIKNKSPDKLERTTVLGKGNLFFSPVKHLSVGTSDKLYVSEYIYSEVDSVVKIIDLEKEKIIGHLGAYGDGPDQILFSNGLHFSGENVSFLDDIKIRLNYWPSGNWDGVRYPIKEGRQFNASSGLIGDAAKFGDAVVTTLLEDVDQSRPELAISRLSQSNWVFIDSFPARTSQRDAVPLDDRLRPSVYESVLCLSRKGDKFALAYTYTDKIKFINSDFENERLLVGPDNFDPEFTTFQTPNGGVSKQPVKEVTKYGWLSVSSSDKYLYGLYSGKLISFEGQPDDYEANAGNIIFKIDWMTGKILNVFELSESRNYRIAVAPDDSILYVVSDGGDTHIDVYRMER